MNLGWCNDSHLVGFLLVSAILSATFFIGDEPREPNPAPAINQNQSNRNGSICFSPFPKDASLQDPVGLPLPRFGSIYTFKFDSKQVIDLHAEESLVVQNLPLDRKFKVEVLLDGHATETFWLDFRELKVNAICLYLSYGYANWTVSIISGKRIGCECLKRIDQSDPH